MINIKILIPIIFWKKLRFEIDKKHQINGIQNTINNLIVYVDNIDAYFIIDKKNLPLELRLGTENKIEKINIPTDSKIKRFMIGWN